MRWRSGPSHEEDEVSATKNTTITKTGKDPFADVPPSGGCGPPDRRVDFGGMHGRFGTILERLFHPDTRFVLQSYAAIAIVAGISIAGTGIRGIPGMALVHASLIWISGMAILAAGCAAYGLSLNNDPDGRRLSMKWFAAGHILLGLLTWMQWGVYWGDQGLPQAVALAPLVVGIVLLMIAANAAGGESAASRIRSTYDEHIRQLARREERARLARDLHDAVKQQLFVIQTAAATAQVRLGADATGALEALTDVRAAAREATTEMEALLDELQATPMEYTGLVEALKKQCEALTLRTGADVRFQPGAQPAAGSLPPGAHEAIYRVAQESLANIARHARATRVDVSLQATPTEFQLRVADNGSGFDRSAPRTGMGITNIESRAAEIGGRVSIASASPGTEAVLTVPLTRAGVRPPWFPTALFGLLALSFGVSWGVSGQPPERFSILLLALYGVWATWGSVVAYRKSSRQRPQ